MTHIWEDRVFKQYELVQGKAHIIVWLEAELRIGQRVTVEEMEGKWTVKQVFNVKRIESTCRDISSFDVPDQTYLEYLR